MGVRASGWILAVALLAACTGSPPVAEPADARLPAAAFELPPPAGPGGATGLDWLAANEPYVTEVADTLWTSPEPAHHEFGTSDLLVGELERAGFRVQRGLADLPTSFVASYGSGRPVIGIVALLDALPGLSQAAFSASRQPVAAGDAGHGCGHHLICAADLGAALAVGHELRSRALPGTIVLVGAPAEEIYHGGVYMVRAGVFDDMDVVLFWHPSTVTMAIGRSGLAMRSVRYRFSGRPSDGTDAGALGINALESAERLVHDVAQMTFPDTTVVNHVISRGGGIPSVVPESGEVWYFVHAPELPVVDAVLERIEEAARRAAAETGAALEVHILSSTRHWLINERLAARLHRELERAPAMSYSEAERALAGEMQRSFGQPDVQPFVEGILPLELSDRPVPISDDTAEASWVRPRGGFLVTSYPAGIASHTWQWTALGTSTLAHKGMMTAARTLIGTAVALLTDPEELAAIASEFDEATGREPYRSPLPAGQGPFEYLPRPTR